MKNIIISLMLLLFSTLIFADARTEEEKKEHDVLQQEIKWEQTQEYIDMNYNYLKEIELAADLLTDGDSYSNTIQRISDKYPKLIEFNKKKERFYYLNQLKAE
jgi:hypothetical protein